MKDTDGEKMFNLYVESLNEARLSDTMPHMGDGRPTPGMSSPVVNNPDHELYTPDMYHQLVVQFGRYVNMYHTAGSEAAKADSRAGAVDAAMRLTNFVRTREGAEQIVMQLQNIDADTEPFTSALAMRESYNETNVQPVIEEGIREFFRGMTVKDVVGKIKEKLYQSDELDPDTTKLENLTNGLLMFSLPLLISKAGRELYGYLTGTMPEDSFVKWLETFMTSF